MPVSPRMTPIMIEYLLSAVEMSSGPRRRVDAISLREKLNFSLREDRDAQRGLEHRALITHRNPTNNKETKRVFWITEAGMRAYEEEHEGRVG